MILIGEHAAVYGRPAVTAALGLRLRVRLQPQPGDSLEISLPQLHYTSSTSWGEVLDYAQQVRARWVEYAEDPSPEGFRKVRGEDPAHVVKVALGEAQGAFDLAGGARLEVVSEIPVGSGCGSSAAVAAGVLGVCAAAVGHPLDPPSLQPLALEVERRQHGLPSGVDTATVLYGGLLWAERRGEGELAVTPVEAHPEHLRRISVLHTGQPSEETGTVVAHVRQRLRDEPGFVEALLQRMEDATRAFSRQLADPNAGAALGAAISAFQTCLEELGVVPPEVRDLIRKVEAHGGAAKISGAGSLGGPGAGTLLVYHSDAGFPATQPYLSSLPRLSASLGDVGLLIESPS